MKDDRSSLEMFIMGLVVIFILMLLSPGLPAQGDCTDPHDQCGHNDEGDNGGGAVIDVMTGDLTVGGDDVLALSVGSLGAGAVQGRCVVTTQFALFVIFKHQKQALEPWCAAQDMDRVGKHEEAAILRCSLPDFPEMYGSETCVDRMNFGPKVVSKSDLAMLYSRLEKYDEQIKKYQAQEQETEIIKEELAIVQTKLSRRSTPRPVPVQIQQQINADAIRRANARKALEGDME